MLGKSFKSSKCKTLLKMAMSRVKLLRNKRCIQVKQMRNDIVKLLGTGQEPSARIRVEHVMREQNILDAYDMIELYLELVVVRMPIIDGQKTCPSDLKEAISSLIFAAPRCADLPELAEIKSCFALKYGKEFVAAAAELRSSCGLSRRLIEKMSVRAPTGEAKLKVLKQIAAEYDIAWDTADAEAELLVQPEETLPGPQKFVSASSKSLTDIAPPQAEEIPPRPQKSSSMPSTRIQPEETVHPKNFVSARRTQPDETLSTGTWRTHSASPTSTKQTENGMDRKCSSFFPEKQQEQATSTPFFKDVASAAQAAALSAEQAAAAARAVEILATREVLQGLSEQILNTDTGTELDEGFHPRYRLRDYLSGKVDHENMETLGSDDGDLAARFEALRARRCS